MTSTSDIRPTDEQLAVVDAAGERTGSAIVNSYAGCAKSTTLELAARRIKVPALTTAFNKKIATDIAARMPSNFTVKTMNALGYMAWGRALPGTTLVMDDRKLGKLVTLVAKDRKIDLSGDQWDIMRQLATSAMMAGIVPARYQTDRYQGFLPDNRDSWLDVADGLLVSQDDFEQLWELSREVVERNIELAKAGTISFDDMVYCPTMLGGRFPQFPVLFVDEAQDLSPLNHEMLRLCGRPDSRIFAVGDEKQAIYSFRGASGRSMELIEQMRPDFRRLPLTTTFRCPKVVVNRQQHHAPGFKAWHTNPDGVYGRFEAPAGADLVFEGWGWADIVERLPSPSATIGILCRNNGPIMSLALKLLRQGIGVQMLGRDIGKGLVSLSRKLAPEDSTSADIVRAKVLEWQATEASLVIANDHAEKVSGINDRAECLLAVLNEEVRTAGELRAVLDRLFSRDTGLVTLGSIHRFKGMEKDLILHLDPWRIPSKFAREAADRGDRTQLTQEYNLKYVAETRTKHTLINANVEDFR